MEVVDTYEDKKLVAGAEQEVNRTLVARRESGMPWAMKHMQLVERLACLVAGKAEVGHGGWEAETILLDEAVAVGSCYADDARED
jgi:hypothetical protein